MADALHHGGLSLDEKILVRTESFDEWACTRRLQRIDLMKIDVEGTEEQVLLGMRRTLELVPPREIICETQWDSPAHRLLLHHGYLAMRLEPNLNGSTGNILYVYNEGQ